MVEILYKWNFLRETNLMIFPTKMEYVHLAGANFSDFKVPRKITVTSDTE